MPPGRRTNEDRDRVRRATQEAFSALVKAVGIKKALEHESYPYSSVPRELIKMINSDTQLDKVFMETWTAACDTARSRLQSAAVQRPTPGGVSQMPMPPLLDWHIEKQKAPPLYPGRRLIRVRISYGSDLMERPWATQLTQNHGVGVSLRRRGGNSFRQWMELQIWGPDNKITEAREWAKKLGARWEVQSVSNTA